MANYKGFTTWPTVGTIETKLMNTAWHMQNFDGLMEEVVILRNITAIIPWDVENSAELLLMGEIMLNDCAVELLWRKAERSK